jgi:hypothetical protein
LRQNDILLTAVTRQQERPGRLQQVFTVMNAAPPAFIKRSTQAERYQSETVIRPDL